MAIPTTAANTTICSTLPSVRAANGLVGTKLRKTCATDGICRSVVSVAVSVVAGLISINDASVRPMALAITAVSINKPMVLSPSRPSFWPSFRSVIALTMAQKINGATNILMARIKRSPSGFSATPTSGASAPINMPRAKAPKTRCQKGIANHALSIQPRNINKRA